MGKQRDNLEAQFEKAGLACRVLTEPIRAINVDIFQADIRRGIDGNQRKEYFRIYKGHEDNLVVVANSDRKINQLVLVVKEPERKFEQKVGITKPEQEKLNGAVKDEWMAIVQKIHRGRGLRGKVTNISSHRNKVYGYSYEARTPSSTRYYLMGVDERQLFIAELPKAATSVAEAHRMLKSNEVTFAEGRAGGKTIRQGEWFFVEATDEERQVIDRAVKNNRASVIRKGNIGVLTGARRGGKPHVAEEAVSIGPGPKLEHGYSVRSRPEIFVRGKVTHPDHATVHLKQWRKVIKNAEKQNDSQPGANGVYWID